MASELVGSQYLSLSGPLWNAGIYAQLSNKVRTKNCIHSEPLGFGFGKDGHQKLHTV